MKINKTVGNVNIQFSTDRIDHNLKEAQKLLNMQIVADSEQFIPFSQGALRGSVRYTDGIYGGEIEYNTPYAHYQYEGIVYGPNIPIKDAAGNISGYWSPIKKTPTQRLLQYHYPGTGSKWFETAKERYNSKWIDLVQKTAGKQ